MEIDNTFEGPDPYNFEPVRPVDHPGVIVGGPLNQQEQWAADNAHRIGNTEWCSCQLCGISDVLEEHRCCQEMTAMRNLLDSLVPRPDTILCITDHPGFQACCLNPYVLQVAYHAYRERHGRLDMGLNEQYRYTAYRQLVRWAHGVLGRHIRKPLPACSLRKIREAYPDVGGHYNGFEWPQLD